MRAVTTQSAGVRVCVFAQCNNNQTTTFKSCKSGTKTSDGNLTGCCSTTGNASLDFGCPGLNDSAKVTMRVNATQSNACTAYTLDYHY